MDKWLNQFFVEVDKVKFNNTVLLALFVLIYDDEIVKSVTFFTLQPA